MISYGATYEVLFLSKLLFKALPFSPVVYWEVFIIILGSMFKDGFFLFLAYHNLRLHGQMCLKLHLLQTLAFPCFLVFVMVNFASFRSFVLFLGCCQFLISIFLPYLVFL